jgi:hypothetical protein
MRSHPDLPELRQEESRELKKHRHGKMYRWKIVPFTGPPEFGEWLGTEADVQIALRSKTRSLGGRYYCEMKSITCSECDTDEAARVICAL